MLQTFCSSSCEDAIGRLCNSGCSLKKKPNRASVVHEMLLIFETNNNPKQHEFRFMASRSYCYYFQTCFTSFLKETSLSLWLCHWSYDKTKPPFYYPQKTCIVWVVSALEYISYLAPNFTVFSPCCISKTVLWLALYCFPMYKLN